MSQTNSNAKHNLPDFRHIPVARQSETRSLLGSGRYGHVYLIRRNNGSELALKTVQGAKSAGLNQLENEFGLLARLRHPHLVEAYDFGRTEDGEQAVFTMEYLQGTHFHDACKAAELKEVASWLVKACLGLDYLHTRGWIHGDVKPENLMIVNGAKSSVKWFDLGMAQRAEAVKKEFLGGTRRFMAPEIQKGFIDVRSDIYSFGVLLFEVLASRFLGDNVVFDAESISKQLDQMTSAGMQYQLADLIVCMTEWSMEERCPRVTHFIDVCDKLNLRSGEDEKTQFCSSPPPFPFIIGRENLICDFEETLQALLGGRPVQSSWLLTGEAGLGKTRLLEEFRIRAQQAGCVFLKIAFGSGQKDSYSPFYEALSDFGEPQPTAMETEFIDGEDAAQQQWDAIGSRLIKFCSQFPTLLVFEDLHLADQEALKLWSMVVRSLRGKRIFMCASFREDENAELQILSRELEQSGWCMTRPLNRLTLDEVTALVSRTLNDEQVDRETARTIWQKSGGNPLYLRLILDQIFETESTCTWSQMSEALDTIKLSGVRELILRRVRGLAFEETSFIEALAVMGRPVQLEEIHQVLGMEYSDVQAVGLRLCSKGFLTRSRSGPGMYEFAHSELRFSIYESIDEEEKKRLHRLAGELSETNPKSRLEETAWHFIRAGEKEKAIQYGRPAARKERQASAYQSAARLFRAVLDFMEDTDEFYAETAMDLALVVSWMGESDKAIRIYEDLLNQKLPEEMRGNLLRKLGEEYSFQGRFDLAESTFEEARWLLKDWPESLFMVRLRSAELRFLISKGDYLLAKEGLLEHLSLSQRFDPDCTAYNYEYLGGACYGMGEYEEAEFWQKKARNEHSRRGNLKGKIRANIRRAHIAYKSSRYTEAECLYREALEFYERFGHFGLAATAMRNIANICYTKGELYESENLNLRALAVYESSNSTGRMASALASFALTQLKQARYTAAQESIYRVSCLEGLSQKILREVRIFEAELSLLLGDLGRAGKLLDLIEESLGDDEAHAKVLYVDYLRAKYLGASGAVKAARKILGASIVRAVQHDLMYEESYLRLELARQLPTVSPVAMSEAEAAFEIASSIKHGILQCEARLMLGMICYERKLYETAIQYFNPCVEKARNGGMKDLCWQAGMLLSACQEALGRNRYAYLYRRESNRLLSTLRNQFSNELGWDNYAAATSRSPLLAFAISHYEL